VKEAADCESAADPPASLNTPGVKTSQCGETILGGYDVNSGMQGVKRDSNLRECPLTHIPPDAN